MALETHADPFDYASAVVAVSYAPLAAARSRWKLCAVFPHIKDEYWLSVAYGMAGEAKRLNVALTITESGGYRGIASQVANMEACVRNGAQSVILGTVSYDSPAIASAVAEAARILPVVAAINDIASRDIAVKVGVSWTDMGREVGRYLARENPPGGPPKRAVLATGPAEAGWVPILSKGLREGMAASSVSIVDEAFADTDTQEQLGITEDLFERNPGIDYFLGSAPAVESAVFVLRSRGLIGETHLIATYYTQAIRRGMLRGRIDAAPFDDPMLQGRLAVESAVRAIEGKIAHRQIGPKIRLATPRDLPPESALAPADYRPIFTIE